MKAVKIGAKGTATVEVGAEHTAHHYGNEGVKVLATPFLTVMFEHAASEVLFPALEESEISVGTWISVKHLKPTPPGVTVTCTATLTEIRGRKYLFEVEVKDPEELVAEGHIERATINSERFYEALRHKS
jgi:predicted thioesterase